MKFRCRKFDLQNELAALASIVDKSAQDEIYSCVRMTNMGNGTVSMSATSRELMLTTSIKTDSSATLLSAEPDPSNIGAFAVSVSRLYELCKKLPDRIIELNYDKEKMSLVVRYDSSRFKLACQEPTFFPSIKGVDSYRYKIPRTFLMNAVKSSLNFITGKEESQIYYSGILISLEDKVLEVVATDGNRLASWMTTMETEQKFRVVLPKKTLSEISTVIEKAGQSALNLEITNNAAFINFGKYTYQSALLVGNWPNYRLVLDAVKTANDTNFRIGRVALRQALDRCMLFVGKDGGFGIDFEFNDKTLSLTAANENGDQANEIVEANCPRPYEIRLNGDFVIKFLDSIPNDDSFDLYVNTLEMMRPVYLRGQSDRNYTYLIQPMTKMGSV